MAFVTKPFVFEAVITSFRLDTMNASNTNRAVCLPVLLACGQLNRENAAILYKVGGYCTYRCD